MSDNVRGTRGITSDTALRLALYFDVSPEFWLNLQSRYDLKIAKRDLRTFIVDSPEVPTAQGGLSPLNATTG
jgi:plasmid maintenance system antidote protein VapI